MFSVRRHRRHADPASERPTRDQLMHAALSLMADNRSFTALSLREVTREAGVAPNTFYRHFADMEDMGLALIDEVGLTLRRLLREARKVGPGQDEILRRSVRVYVDFVRAHPHYFLFAVRERAGGSARIRAALQREIGYFTTELAHDLALLRVYPHLSMGTLELIAGLVINTMLHAATELVQADATPTATHDAAFIDGYVRRLALVFLGGAAWKEHPSPAASAAAVPAPEAATQPAGAA